MRRKDKREVKGIEWGWLARVERGWHGLTFTPNLGKKKYSKNRNLHHIAEAF